MSARRTALIVLIAAISAVAALSTGLAAAGAPSRITARSGTETIEATSTRFTPTSVTVHASGLYAATGTFRIPVTDKATTLHFVFGTGTLTVDASAAKVLFGNYDCPLNVKSYRTYTISPTQSTGIFAMATGSSDYLALTTQDNPRLSNGDCDLASNIKPISGTVYVSIVIKGTLTLRGDS
jgi:hypothetical protein